MIDFPQSLETFFTRVASGSVEIYNEFSLQHELGLYLRFSLTGELKVQFERPVSSFFDLKQKLEKKEIDIAIFTPDKSIKYAIELKYPRNGQYPEQMFKACQDIRFLEQLCENGFEKCFFVMVADDDKFYVRTNKIAGIYQYFRGDTPINGIIQKPTGIKDHLLEIRESYRIVWKDVSKRLKYTVVEIGQ
jgi:hypothetical protein